MKKQKHIIPEDIKLIMEQNPTCFYEDNWIGIIPYREPRQDNIKAVNIHLLKEIIQHLTNNATYNMFLGERTTQNKYKLSDVQRLVDFAYAMHYKYEQLKQTAIDNNVGQYNPKTGEFELIATTKE